MAKLKDKVQTMPDEARMLVPGAQVLLGFYLRATFEKGFERPPDRLKYVHLASLALVAVSIVLLMTPAAYHRIVERGEETEHFHRFSSRVLPASMIPLALSVTGSFFVVIDKVTHSGALAAASSAVLLLLFFGLWFGYTFYVRSRGHEHAPHSAMQPQTGD